MTQIHLIYFDLNLNFNSQKTFLGHLAGCSFSFLLFLSDQRSTLFQLFAVKSLKQKKNLFLSVPIYIIYPKNVNVLLQSNVRNPQYMLLCLSIPKSYLENVKNIMQCLIFQKFNFSLCYLNCMHNRDYSNQGQFSSEPGH